MTEYAKLVISVDSTQVNNADKSLLRLEGTAGKAERAAGNLGRTLGRAAAAVGTYLSVREVARAAETYTNLTNRLRLVTNGTEELAIAQESLFDIAQRSRQPLAETAELYQRVATNQRELGLTSAGVGRIVETINKSLSVSGTSAASAAGAITQLGQAFASGQLRGEELNSVLENAPALAQALARGMGVTVGELRQLGQEGELTAKKVVDALLDQSAAIDQSFGTIKPTVSSALTTVDNAFTQLIGRMDETSDASSGAAGQIMELAAVLSDPATIQAAQALAGGVAQAFSTVVKGATEMVDFVRWAGQEAAAFMNGIAADDIVRLQREVERLEELKNSSFLDRTILFGRDGLIEYYDDAELDAELNKLKGAIAEALATPPINPPQGSGDAPKPPVFTTGGGSRSGGGSGTRRLSDAEKEAQRLLKLFQDTENSINRQIALYGNASDAARLRYELERGSLQALSSEQKQRLRDLQDELDAKEALNEIQNINLELLRETGQERAARDLQFELEYAERIAEYERQGNEEALARLRVLRQIREVNAQPEPGTVEGVSKAPGSDFGGLNTTGFITDLERLDEQAEELQQWREQELERQREYLELKEIEEEVHAERVANIYEQSRERLESIEKARQDVMLQAGASFFGDMSDLAKVYAGEQSGIYKALFTAQKAYSTVSVLLSSADAIGKAWASAPFPANLPAVAIATAETGALKAIVNAASPGFQQGGYTGNMGISDVAGVVHGREFVFDADATARIGVQNLEAIRRGQQAPAAANGDTYYNATVNARFAPGMTNQEMRRASSAVSRDVSNQLRKMQRFS